MEPVKRATHIHSHVKYVIVASEVNLIILGPSTFVEPSGDNLSIEVTLTCSKPQSRTKVNKYIQSSVSHSCTLNLYEAYNYEFVTLIEGKHSKPYKNRYHTGARARAYTHTYVRTHPNTRTLKHA